MMRIPDEELGRYNQFAIAIAHKLKCTEIDPEAVLWHYTNGAGLLGIFSSQSIYSTQVSCLNDSEEIRFASRIFRKSLEEHIERVKTESESVSFISEALKYFAENPTTPNHVALPHFVACFSEVGNDLSQWRAYAGGENGYALGFKAKHLTGIPNCFLGRVTYYNEDEHKTLADEVAEATIHFFKDGLQKFGTSDPEGWTLAFLTQWDNAITQVAPLVKHPAFGSEKECRLIKAYTFDDLPDLRFIQKNTLLSRHLPLRPHYLNESETYCLPISELVVGPCRHPHVSRISAGTLLQQHGYDSRMVKISDTPFQAT